MDKRPISYAKLRYVLLTVAALALSVGYIPSYATAVQEYTAKAILSLNLARFTEWPPEVFKDNNATVNLCLLGDGAIQEAFAMIDKKQVGNKVLSIRSINDSKHLEQCQLLYISAEAEKMIGLYEESYKLHILQSVKPMNFLSTAAWFIWQ